MMNTMNTYNTFFECDFSRNFWAAIGMEWNTNLNTIEMLMEGKSRDQSQGFKEKVIAGC